MVDKNINKKISKNNIDLDVKINRTEERKKNPFNCYTIDVDGNLVNWNEISKRLSPKLSDKIINFIPSAVSLIEKEKLKHQKNVNKEVIKLDKNLKEKLDSIIFIHPDLPEVIEKLSNDIESKDTKTRNTDNVSFKELLAVLDELRKEMAQISVSHSISANYEQIVENSLDMIWSVDINGKFNSVNPIAQKYFGCKMTKILGKSLYSFMDTKSMVKLSEVINTKINKKSPHFQFECNFINKNGSSRKFETNCTPIFDVSDELILLTGVSREITQRTL